MALPPAAIPFILSFVVALLYSLFAAPLFASSAFPDRNTPSLTVFVTDLDGGLIGSSFTQFISSLPPTIIPNIGASSVTLPTFVVLKGASADDMINKVKQSDGYASITINAGASSALQNALQSDALASTYLKSGRQSAITLTWDEARQNTVTVSRVGAPCKALLASFSTALSISQTTAYLASASITSSTISQVLSNPVGFSEINLYPLTLPAVNQGLTVGLILLAVFSLVATNLIHGPAEKGSWLRVELGIPKAFRRVVLILLYTMTTSAAYSTILLGLANTGGGNTASINGVGRPFDGSMWAQLWAIQWLHMTVLCTWLMCAVELGGVPAAGFALAPLIIYNALSLNTDVSDPGYKFFYYAPFWHAGESSRFVLFGTLSSRFSMHIGVLWAWLIFEIILLFSLHIRSAKLVALKASTEKITSASPPEAVVESSGTV